MAVRKVGAVAIEAIGETAGFEKDLEKGLKKAVAEASKDSSWDPLVTAAANAGGHSAAAFTFRFKSKTSHEFESGGFLDSSRLSSLFSKAGTNAAGFFSKAFTGATEAASGLFSNIPLIGGLISSIASIGGGGFLAQLTAVLVAVTVLTVALPLLTAAFFALGGVLVGLAGTVAAVPTLLTGVLVTILPLIIAFQGFGDAIGALTSGDLDKFNESLKKLTPSAASFAREIQRVMPFFSSLRKLVQEAFFAEIIGSLETFTRRAGPAISGGLGMVATALGNLAAGLLALFSRREVVVFMSRLFEAVADGLTAATPTMIRFFDAFLSLANAALPVVSDFLIALGGSFDEFSNFLKDTAGTADFENFLRDAFEILGDVGLILKDIVVLAGVMFGSPDTRQSAKSFLESVDHLLSGLIAWFQSPDGEDFLKNMARLTEVWGDILEHVILPVLTTILGTINNAVDGMRILGSFVGVDTEGPARSGGRNLRLGRAAGGGITQGPVIAGEAGTEAILPMDDPVRARQIASDPIVQNVIGGSGDTIVYAIFDGEPFQARIVRTTRGALAETSRQLTQKPRTVLA